MSVIFQMGINYVGIAQIILGICSLIIAGIAIWYTRKSIKQQQIHNEKSVKPILNVRLVDGIDRVELGLHNRGVGPLIIKDTIITYENKKYNGIEKLFEEIGVNKEGMVVSILKNCTILPNQKEDLLNFLVDKTISKSISKLDVIRKTVAKIGIRVEYCDIYDNANSFNYKPEV